MRICPDLEQSLYHSSNQDWQEHTLFASNSPDCESPFCGIVRKSTSLFMLSVMRCRNINVGLLVVGMPCMFRQLYGEMRGWQIGASLEALQSDTTATDRHADVALQIQ